MNNLLTLESITKIYGDNTKMPVVALQSFSLKIEKGDMLCITGPSGSGKSTLMNTIGGLERPTSGKVYFEGNDIYQMKIRELDIYRNQNIGFIFQFHYLLDELNALENVMLPALIGGIHKNIANNLACELLETVGLKDRLKHLPKEMSGGEQQRVAVARALINNPKLILADEPTGNLDKGNSENIENILFDLNSKGITIILVTHDERFSKKCKNTLHLKK